MSMKILSVKLIKADAEQRFDIEGKYWTIRFEIHIFREKTTKTGLKMKASRARVAHTHISSFESA